MCHNLVNRQIQYTNCPISHLVKTNRQWNLVSSQDITTELFFCKNYAENEAQRLVPDYFVF